MRVLFNTSLIVGTQLESLQQKQMKSAGHFGEPKQTPPRMWLEILLAATCCDCQHFLTYFRVCWLTTFFEGRQEMTSLSRSQLVIYICFLCIGKYWSQSANRFPKAILQHCILP